MAENGREWPRIDENWRGCAMGLPGGKCLRRGDAETRRHGDAVGPRCCRLVKAMAFPAEANRGRALISWPV